MTAILLGSISTLADTSELQRAAFNAAFAEHGLDWSWSREEYLPMLEGNGGRDRVAAYAGSRGEAVDADAVHATKSAIFQKSLSDSGITPRDGVVETIRAAKSKGLKVALVTTTSPGNVMALGDALAPYLSLDDLDLVVDSSQVETFKPDPEAYSLALARLGENAADCVAVEDNVGGAASAVAAGVTCVAFPNANTAGHVFAHVAACRDRLDFADLQGFIAH